MKHLLAAVAAVALAVTVALIIRADVHSPQGIIAAVVGFPGVFASIKVSPNRDNYGLMMFANSLYYFGVGEAVFAVRQHLRRKRTRTQASSQGN